MNNKAKCMIGTLATLIIGAMTGASVGLYYYFNVPFYKELNIKGLNTLNNNEILYLKVNDNAVSYDIIDNIVGTDNYLLTRFFIFDNTHPTLCQTILNKNYTKLSNWDIVNIDTKEDSVIDIELTNRNIKIDIDGILMNIKIDNRKPVHYENYDILKYSFDKDLENEPVFDILNSISNPNSTDINNDTNITNPLLPPRNADPQCMLSLINQAMNSGQNLVKTGNCNGYKVVAVAGTNFKEAGDIWADVVGALGDNFKTGFERLKNFDFKVYDICAGYSLGGGIVKYMATQNYCKNVFTIASPYTLKYNNKIPIVQYANTIDDEEGCCKFNWLGECKEKGMFLADPVTLILTGSHRNLRYIGNRKNNNCVGTFAYTVWKSKFALHMLGVYEDNLPRIIE